MNIEKLGNLRLSTEILDANEISANFIHKDGTLDNGSINLSVGQLTDKYGKVITNKDGSAHEIKTVLNGTNISLGTTKELNGTPLGDLFQLNIGIQNEVSGLLAFAHGKINNALGRYSFVTGYKNTATADTSFANGQNVSALADYSHAEGNTTFISKDAVGSHTEGTSTSALTSYCHVEGRYNITTAERSHAEGEYNVVNGTCSHAEGTGCLIYGYAAHAEGQLTSAFGSGSHTEGLYTYSSISGEFAHAEGRSTIVSGLVAHAEGDKCLAAGYASHAEGHQTSALGYVSHSNGKNAIAIHKNTWIWNGDTTEPDIIYSTSSDGEFYINPINNISGFYIGNNSLNDIFKEKLNDINRAIDFYDRNTDGTVIKTANDKVYIDKDQSRGNVLTYDVIKAFIPNKSDITSIVNPGTQFNIISGFKDCSRIVDVNMKGIVEIGGNSAFESCYQLKELKNTDDISSFSGSYLFRGSPITSINAINLKNVKQNWQMGASTLSTIYVDNEVFRSGDNGYGNLNTVLKTTDNTKLVTVMPATTRLSSNVERVLGAAFNGCGNMTDMTFTNLNAIESNNFSGCKSLLSLILDTPTVPSLASGDDCLSSLIKNRTPNLSVFVRSDMLDSFKTTKNWNTQPDRIFEL